jgi:lipopolysaccharide/colanic/teichoic acid biosynthesis glycosyltransferase
LAEQLTEAHLLGAELSPEGIAITAVDHPYRGTTYGQAKGVLDRLLAVLLLLLASPVLGAIALSIRLDSPGPVLFRQQRIGLGGRPFTMYKFRSMFADAPNYSYKVAISDRRITRVGRWLRRSGLDELPQLINVLRGEMSLIGPRPEQPFIVDQFEPWQHARHAIKPGITGWWQIHHRDDVPLHLNLEYDMYYLAHLSFFLDCLIAWRTIKIMVAGCVAFLSSST